MMDEDRGRILEIGLVAQQDPVVVLSHQWWAKRWEKKDEIYNKIADESLEVDRRLRETPPSQVTTLPLRAAGG